MAERHTAKRSEPEQDGQAPRASVDALDICPCCDSRLVYPIEWEPAGRDRWAVGLRCPECEWLGGGTYEQRVVDAFDDVLDRGTEELLDQLTVMSRANLEEEIDRFVAALEADRILPEDF